MADKLAFRLDVSTIRSNIRALTSHHPGRINYVMDETWRRSIYFMVGRLGGRVHMAKTVQCLPKSMFPFFHSNGNFSWVYDILHFLAFLATTYGMTGFWTKRCKKTDMCYFQVSSLKERGISSFFRFLLGYKHGGLHSYMRSIFRQQSAKTEGAWIPSTMQISC